MNIRFGAGLVAALMLLGVGCWDLGSSTTVRRPNVGSAPSSNSLDLSGQGLTNIASSVFEKTELEELNVSDNNLTGALPGEIRHLQDLRVLDASNNQMTGVPAEIGQLSQLEVLDLSNNQLTGLPMELGNLTNLQVLDLSGNDVSAQDLEAIRVKLTDTEIRI